LQGLFTGGPGKAFVEVTSSHIPWISISTAVTKAKAVFDTTRDIDSWAAVTDQGQVKVAALGGTAGGAASGEAWLDLDGTSKAFARNVVAANSALTQGMTAFGSHAHMYDSAALVTGKVNGTGMVTMWQACGVSSSATSGGCNGDQGQMLMQGLPTSTAVQVNSCVHLDAQDASTPSLSSGTGQAKTGCAVALSPPTREEGFGSSVAVDSPDGTLGPWKAGTLGRARWAGCYVAVGSTGASTPGSVHIYTCFKATRTDAGVAVGEPIVGFRHLETLLPPWSNTLNGEEFGAAIATGPGGLLYVGSPQADGGRGRVEVYQRLHRGETRVLTTTPYTHRQTLRHPQALETGGRFGHAVATSRGPGTVGTLTAAGAWQGNGVNGWIHGERLVEKAELLIGSPGASQAYLVTVEFPNHAYTTTPTPAPAGGGGWYDEVTVTTVALLDGSRRLPDGATLTHFPAFQRQFHVISTPS